MEKLCVKCKIMKKLEDFHIKNRYKDGRDYYCKICRNLDNYNWQKRNLINKKINNAKWYWNKKAKQTGNIEASKTGFKNMIEHLKGIDNAE